MQINTRDKQYQFLSVFIDQENKENILGLENKFSALFLFDHKILHLCLKHTVDGEMYPLKSFFCYIVIQKCREM